MTRAINAMSDRLLALVVPRAAAKADCGEYYQFCFCDSRGYYRRLCCRTTGLCGNCRYAGPYCH
jgi:hypothetical protein